MSEYKLRDIENYCIEAKDYWYSEIDNDTNITDPDASKEKVNNLLEDLKQAYDIYISKLDRDIYVSALLAMIANVAQSRLITSPDPNMPQTGEFIMDSTSLYGAWTFTIPPYENLFNLTEDDVEYNSTTEYNDFYTKPSYTNVFNYIVNILPYLDNDYVSKIGLKIGKLAVDMSTYRVFRNPRIEPQDNNETLYPQGVTSIYKIMVKDNLIKLKEIKEEFSWVIRGTEDVDLIE